jgi:hypothetical protein
MKTHHHELFMMLVRYDADVGITFEFTFGGRESPPIADAIFNG